MLCPICGSTNDADSAFCQSCGVRLSQDQTAFTPAEPGTARRLERDAVPYVAFSNFEVGLHTDPWLEVQWDKHKNPIPEALDQEMPERMLHNSLELSMKDEHEANYREVLNTHARSELYVTSSRVILACRTWEEASISVVALAKHYKVIGHVYGGHIRYEWLNEIRFWDDRGFIPACYVQLSYKDAAGNDYMTEIATGRGFGRPHPTDIATQVLTKACRYRLAMTDTKTDEQVDFFTRNAQTPQFSHAPGDQQWWSIKIPGAYPASAGQEFRPR